MNQLVIIDSSHTLSSPHPFSSTVHDEASAPPLLRVSSLNNQKVPPEVLARIFELACRCSDGRHKECSRTWWSASLVCKGWRAEAQRALFPEILLDTSRSLHALSAGPLLGKVTTKKLFLQDRFSNKKKTTCRFGKNSDIEALHHLLDNLVGLEVLEIEYLGAVIETFGGRPIEKKLFMSANLASLSSLVLKNFSFNIGRSEVIAPLPLRLQSLAIDEVFGSEYPDASSAFQLFFSQPLERFSLGYEDMEIEGSEELQKLLRSMARTLKFLEIKTFPNMPLGLVPLFTLFSHLSELKIRCDPDDLIYIANLIPSRLQFLTPLNIWHEEEGKLYDPGWPATLPAVLRASSMKELKEIRIENVSEATFLQKVDGARKMMKKVKKAGVAVRFVMWGTI